MEQFYPAVAKKHQRSIGAVESAMRRAIIDAYESGVASDRFLLYFKRSAKEIPSVSEFVSVLATHIRYSLCLLYTSIPAIAFGQNILTHCLHGFSGDDLPSNGSLDGDFKHLTRNHVL